MKKLPVFMISLYFFVLLASACSPSSKPTEKSNLVFTAAAETVAVQLTQHAEQNKTPPTKTLTPPASPTYTQLPLIPSPSPTTTPTLKQSPTNPNPSSPCDQAEFVADVTIPDGTILSPGVSFTKTWRLLNSGTCSWKTTYSLVYAGGDRLGGPDSVKIPQDVAPGTIINLSIELKAPDKTGEFTSYYKLSNQNGERFGIKPSNASFWVKIIVQSITITPSLSSPTTISQTSTPGITPTISSPTPIPTTHTLTPTHVAPAVTETKKP